MSGFHRLRVDVPDSSGVWPNGRIEVVNGGGGNGGMYLRILPTGGRGKDVVVVVALRGESHYIVGNIGDVQIPKAQILATGRSEIDRREAPHEQLVIAARLRDDQILMVDQIAGGEQWWWVFSACGTEKFSRHNIVPALATIIGS